MPTSPYRKTPAMASRFSQKKATERTLSGRDAKTRTAAAPISVVIPVLGESLTINDTIGHIVELPFSDGVEIIVVDGERETSTITAIQHPEVVKVSSGPGRGIQMNAGAERARGETLLFLHADTRLPKSGFKAIHHALRRPDISGGTFRLGIASSKPSIRLIETVANIRTRLLRMPYGDQGIFMRREAFLAMGGFRPYPIMEDVDLILRIRKRRLRFVLLDESVSTSARRWEREGAVGCTLRNWMLMTLFFSGIEPERLARFYRTWR